MKKNKYIIKSLVFGIAVALAVLTAGVARAMAAGVSLGASPATQTVTAGQTATYTIKINRDNYADKVTLSATNLPAGATAVFTPNTTTAATSVLTVKTLTTTPVGTFTLNVKATAPGIAIAPITVKLTTQAAPSISVSVTPQTQLIVAGQPAFYDVAIKRINYDGPLTLTAENLPDGVTVRFEPETTYGNSSRMYLYSGGLPSFPNQFGMIVRVRGIADIVQGLGTFYAVVNCGIEWTAQYGTSSNQVGAPDYGTDVNYDENGNVYITGYQESLTVAGETNAWVAKYSPSGALLWHRVIANLEKDRPTDVFADAAGNLYVAGITLIPAPTFTNFNIFVAKFDANGNQNPRIQTLGTLHEEGASGMQFGTDAQGRTTLTAVTEVIRNGVGTDDDGNQLHDVNFDVTRFTFDANFNLSGGNSPIAANLDGNPKDLYVGADGSIYVLRENLENTAPVTIPPFGGVIQIKDVLVSVVKLNAPTGQSNWTTAWIDPSPTAPASDFAARALTADADGNVFAVGNTEESAFFSRILALNAAGSIRWERTFNFGSFKTEITDLDTDAAGNLYFSGYTFDSLRGTNPNRGFHTDPNARSDAFFGKMTGSSDNLINLQQFNVVDKDGFNALEVGGDHIYFAGYTVAFGMNYGLEDWLLMKYSVRRCFLWL